MSKASKVFSTLLCLIILSTALTVHAAPTQQQIDNAIQKGLAWLKTQQADDGHFGDGYSLAGTAFAVLAFEEKGNIPGKNQTYSAAVEKGLNYIFQHANIYDIEPQPAGNPDSNNNGKCVYFSESNNGYETPICLMAIVGSKSPSRVVTTGPCNGWKYSDVVREAIDYLAFGQDDFDAPDNWDGTRGGWRYDSNSGSDNSVSQWSVTGLIAAELWGIKAPNWVKTELNHWVNFIQKDDGGSGYQSREEFTNMARTGALITEMFYLGDNPNTPRASKAIKYLNNWENWNQEPIDYDEGNKGNPYAMYAIHKALKLMNVQSLPQALNGGDWWGDYAQFIVDTQNPDGSWDANIGYDTWLDTSWYILILEGNVFSDIDLTVKANPTSLPADGVSTSIVTATLKDSIGNPWSGQKVVMEVTKGKGSIGQVTDNGNGTYSATYRASNQAGVETVTATVLGTSKSVDITLTPAVTTITLDLVANPSTLPADGKSTSTITATVKDSNGKPLAGQSVSMAVTKGKGTISKVSDKGDGTYVATYTASNQAGVETVTATVSNISKSVDITLTSGAEPGRKLIIPEVMASAGADVTVPINISDASGVAGADIEVTYDKDILTIKEVKVATLTTGFSISPNTSIPGLIIMAMANSNAIPSGNGTFVNMLFAVKAGLPAGTETPVNFKSASIYDINGTSIPAGTQNGKVKIGVACVKGDVNNDGKVNSADAILALRIASGVLVATEQQKCAADMNNDGKVNSADAILILRKASGLAPERIATSIKNSRKIVVTLDEIYGKAGDIIDLPIRVDNSHILAGGDISLSYNNSVIRAIEVFSDAGTMLAGNITEPGIVKIAFASSDNVKDDVIATIKFLVLTDDSSPFILKSLELYDSNANPLNTKVLSGRFASYLSRPKYSALMQNYPNPFNPETIIPYQLKEDTEVTIWILNAKGEVIRKLDLGHKSAGIYLTPDRGAHWDGKDSEGMDVVSGVYFYSIKAGDFSAVKKMIVTK